MECAFGMEAYKHYYTVKYIRLPDLLLDLQVARDSGTFASVLKKYTRPVLLIIDEWLLLKLTESVNILRWQSHPISRNRATGSVIESRSSDGGSHDLCRGSQYGDLAFDRSFPLPHGYFPVNPHGIGRWYDAVKDRIGKGTASQSFMPAFRHEL